MTSQPKRRPLSTLIATVIAAGFLIPGVALAEEPQERKGKPLEEYLREQLEGGELKETFRNFLKKMEPMAEELNQMMRDLPQYDAPEMLPNGDIIIRRRRGGDEIET